METEDLEFVREGRGPELALAYPRFAARDDGDIDGEHAGRGGWSTLATRSPQRHSIAIL